MPKRGEPLLIPNAGEDPRFLPRNSAAGRMPALSYAGIPLIASAQQVVGSFALLAVKPNQFQQEHLTLLEILGRQAVTRLELYSRIRLQEQAQRCASEPNAHWPSSDVLLPPRWTPFRLWSPSSTPPGDVRMNQPCLHLTGLTLADAVGRPFVEQVLQPATATGP